MSLKLIQEILKKQTADLQALSFNQAVSHVYNAYVHAWEPHLRFLELMGTEPGKHFFLGMNPGPFGMNQTGVPFGSVPHVRDWMKLTDAGLIKDIGSHPKRPIEGFATRRIEVSGQRFWGLFESIFGESAECFKRIFVANYCPLMFVNDQGANITPEVLSKEEKKDLEAICDRALGELLSVLRPVKCYGLGLYAHRALARLKGPWELVLVPHPSPANPRASRLWPHEIEAMLRSHGVFE